MRRRGLDGTGYDGTRVLSVCCIAWHSNRRLLVLYTHIVCCIFHRRITKSFTLLSQRPRAVFAYVCDELMDAWSVRRSDMQENLFLDAHVLPLLCTLDN
jgi:hypothetical protein